MITIIKTIDDMVELVRTMRLAQKEYFHIRGHHNLLQAKKIRGDGGRRRQGAR
jgi:hypothetical protein